MLPGSSGPTAAAGGGVGGGAGHGDDPSPSKSHSLCSKAQQDTAAHSSGQHSAGVKRRLLQPSGKQKQSAKQPRVEDVKSEAGEADMKAAAGGQGAGDRPAAGGKGKGAAGKNRPKGTSGGSAAAPLPGTVLSAAAQEAGREQAAHTGTANGVRPLANIPMAGEAAGAAPGEVSRSRRPAARSTEAETVPGVAELKEELATARAKAAAAERDSGQLMQQLATAQVEAAGAKAEAVQLREQLVTAQGEAAGAKAEAVQLREQLVTAQVEAAAAGAEAVQGKEQLAASQTEAATAGAEAVQAKEQLAASQAEAAAVATKLAVLTSDLPQLLQHVGAWFKQQQGEAQQLQKETQELCAQKVAALASLAGMDLPVGLLGPQPVEEQQGVQEGRDGVQGQGMVAGSDGVGRALQLLGDEAVKVKGEVEKLQQRKRGVLGVVVPGAEV